jgi:hypothetical protein
MDLVNYLQIINVCVGKIVDRNLQSSNVNIDIFLLYNTFLIPYLVTALYCNLTLSFSIFRQHSICSSCPLLSFQYQGVMVHYIDANS